MNKQNDRKNQKKGGSTMKMILFDLEATCEHDGSIEHEVIEIGAVKVNETGEILDTFTTFVKPDENPVLTDFCKNLTSIQQSDVDSAPTFQEAIQSFREWIGDESYALGSWGFYDKKQLQKQLSEYNMDTDWLTPHTSLKHAYAEFNHLKRACGVQKALKREGMTFEGTAHRGIDDAKNIARIYAKYPDEFLKTLK